MKETQALLARAQRYLASAELLLDAGDYESSDLGRTMPCFMQQRLRF